MTYLINSEDFKKWSPFLEFINLALDKKASERFDRLEQQFLVAAFKKCNMTFGYPISSNNPYQYISASHECFCQCGLKYIEHPLDWRIIGYRDYPFLRVLCDGIRVKL